jgi:hypothetical protein
MKPVISFTLSAALSAFGIVFLFRTLPATFDLFDTRLRAGNDVLLITSFFPGVMVLLAAAFALLKRMRTSKLQALPVVKAGIVAFFPVWLLLASCGQRQGEVHDHQAADVEESHHHEGDVEHVTLNNGEKWEADAHTAMLVKEMKLELSDFEKAGADDYHALADSLSRQLSVLVAGCTMEGPAHDELHKWLIPVTENVRGLAAAQEASGARDNVKKIEEGLREFDDFFEGQTD